MGRQGDVVVTTHIYDDHDELVPVEPPSAAAVDVPRDPRLGVVLQAGAVTGHHHHMPGGVTLSREPSGATKLVVGEAVEPLEHDEHAPIEVPVGAFAVGIQVEYVPGDLPRQVED
jgi:hypothetical protein